MKHELDTAKLRRKWRWEPTVRSLRMWFTLYAFLVLVLNMVILAGVELFLAHRGLLDEIDSMWKAAPLLMCALASLPIGTLICFIVIRLPMQPVKKLLEGMTQLANGHYDERIDLGPAKPLKEMADSFNALATELQNTEMLRKDFVNNFSHEFKTPIVSINGFATILMGGGLTEEEQKEYIAIIAEESGRLANMATNVLSLTKVENQSILTDVQEFNLSEQVRRCILMLAKKWTAKQLEIQAEFQEHIIRGTPDLLKQVWVNLLDNAVKFSPEGAEVSISISESPGGVTVSITNHGPAIPPEDQKRMFDKFWQGDTSHASEGTGVGLPVVKKIVELHRGYIDVSSDQEETTFTVHLPK